MLTVGVLYVAVGVEKVFTQVSNEDHRRVVAPLGWVPLVALYGGVVVYLAGRAGIRWRADHSASTVAFVATGVPVLLLPVARLLPALAALGLVTAALTAAAVHHAISTRQRQPGTP